MERPEDRPRLENLCRQLLKMSNGDFSQRVERTENKDDLEALIVLVNILSDRISESIIDLGYTRSFYSYTVVAQMLFILDGSFQILEIDKGVRKLLQYGGNEILDVNFENLLSVDSKQLWAGTTKEIVSGRKHERLLKLSFLTKKGVLFPTYCQVIHFPYGKWLKGKTLVTSIDIAPRKKIFEESLRKEVQKNLQGRVPRSQNKNKHKYNLHTSDLKSIRTVEKYILVRLDEPLPILTDLAHTLGINEFKLKWGFKQLYGMTVFQFIKDQRLRKVHVLVRYTNKSIGSIARSVGFKQGNHLAREFKKRYGYSPSDLRDLSSR